jgi:glycerol-1-phosphate dehydrogenase [NAD(P)+]
MPYFSKEFPNTDDYEVYFVSTLEANELKQDLKTIEQKSLASGEPIRCIIGLGGGQAIDVAKFFSWMLGSSVPLFQVPTALTVDAPWGHRAAIRYEGVVRYVGFAVPQAVYIDFGIIQKAPKRLNLSGVGDVLCFHTADADWKIAQEDNKFGDWPYDESIANQAKQRLDTLLNNLSEIKAMSEKGIKIICSSFQFGGCAFHSFGWNPRPLEGFDHLFFYALEHRTGKHFIHGYPVMLGIYLGSLLQNNRPEWILDIVKNGCGIDIRPEEMHITWDDVKETLLNLSDFVKEKEYMYTIASREGLITEEWVEEAKKMLYDFYKD